jgi:tryptophan synthase alpha chain
MSRLQNLFATKKAKVLNVYCTAGYPKLDSTIEVIQALQNNGADIIELGMPYSDPLADGEVIQQSGSVALQNGMTIELLFNQLHNLRTSPSFGGVGEASNLRTSPSSGGVGEASNLRTSPSSGGVGEASNLRTSPTLGGVEEACSTPIILMGYMNPVLQYGFEKFCAAAANVGIDGLILPDLPIYEFENTYREILKKYNLDFIFLVTPETSIERIKKIDELSTGFIYAVSSSSTTGNNKPIEDQVNYFKKLQQLNLQNPILVGFGIKDKFTFDSACQHTNGAIIGSAYIKALQNTNDINATTASFLQQIFA